MFKFLKCFLLFFKPAASSFLVCSFSFCKTASRTVLLQSTCPQGEPFSQPLYPTSVSFLFLVCSCQSCPSLPQCPDHTHTATFSPLSWALLLGSLLAGKEGLIAAQQLFHLQQQSGTRDSPARQASWPEQTLAASLGRGPLLM